MNVCLIKNRDYECRDYGTFLVPDGVDLEAVLKQIAKRLSGLSVRLWDWDEAVIKELQEIGIKKLDVAEVVMPEWHDYNDGPAGNPFS